MKRTADVPDIREVLPPHTGAVFAAIRELRPTFNDREAFVGFVDGTLRPEGYRLVATFEPEANEAVSVAGFRVLHMLSRGRFIYVDDLSTIPVARRRGHARRLLNWLFQEARRLDCARLHLDSGVGPDRHDAHRLYLNAGLAIAAYHFTRSLK